MRANQAANPPADFLPPVSAAVRSVFGSLTGPLSGLCLLGSAALLSLLSFVWLPLAAFSFFVFISEIVSASGLQKSPDVKFGGLTAVSVFLFLSAAVPPAAAVFIRKGVRFPGVFPAEEPEPLWVSVACAALSAALLLQGLLFLFVRRTAARNLPLSGICLASAVLLAGFGVAFLVPTAFFVWTEAAKPLSMGAILFAASVFCMTASLLIHSIKIFCLYGKTEKIKHAFFGKTKI